MDLNAIGGQIVDAAMKVHSVLGPGLARVWQQMRTPTVKMRS